MNKPLFLFAHGAGLPSTSPWMQTWDGYLSQIGRVVRFDYPYMAKRGKGPPDRLPKLLSAHRQTLAEERQKHAALGYTGPVVLIGKSMGGRVGCHLSLEVPVDGLICLGYPLCGGGKREKLRDQVLKNLQVPILFVQGTRDRMCPLELLDEVRGQMHARTHLHVVPTGDHSLILTKAHTRTTGRTQADEDTAAMVSVAVFAAGLAQRQV